MEWIVNADGSFPYVEAKGDVPAETLDPSTESANRWTALDACAGTVVVLSYDALSTACLALNEGGTACKIVSSIKFGPRYYMITDYSSPTNKVYTNSSGSAYVALAESSATDISYDYIINEDNSTTVNDSQIIQIDDGILNIIDDSGTKVQLTIDSLTFDTGAKNYIVNAYNTTYEGDEYYYTYYTYNITYNITNTYINYIGSNAAYEKKEYEYYYQLPDGRSSADLTADEMAGMSFQFHDVVNYKRSPTDFSVRALYHFDGDTRDSSYFSTQGEFTWLTGASITYMEAPAAFDGALYLDSTPHAFSVSLPTSLGSGEFSLQFRYYQVSEPDTQDNINNSVSIDGVTLLSWDEQALYYGSSKIASLPVGTWAEIALVRKGRGLSIYVNGLRVHTTALTTVLDKTFTFTLGEGSRSYSMVDELRVVNFALADGGASYTPTAVPFDSNLVLVLPDSVDMIADEFWHWDTTISPDYALDLTGGYYSPISTFSWNASELGLSLFSQGRFLYDPSCGSLGVYDGFVNLSALSGSASTPTFSTSGIILGGSGFYIPLWSCGIYGMGREKTGPYTVTLVDTDANLYSMTFDPANTSGGSVTTATSQAFSWGSMTFYSYFAREDTGQLLHSYLLRIDVDPGETLDLIYLEVVPGSSANQGHEKRSFAYWLNLMQANTAAVQSDIPVRGYTVGGVRPTLPSRGDCWFPVSGGRIQTCYIYTGSLWEEAGCRWYTGSRWIPIYAFDLDTLEDLFDIADASDAIAPITSEEGFWRWWQLQWVDFRTWLESALPGLGSGGSSSSDPLLPGVSGSETEEGEEGEGWSFLGLLGAVKDGVWRVTVGIVTTGVDGVVGLVAGVVEIGGFFDAFDRDSPDNIFGVVDYGGDDIWD